MFRCFKTILGASVIGGVLLGLMIKIPHFFKIILGTSVIVGVLLGLWRWTYDKSCFSLVFVLLILGIVAYSYISLKMHQRKCFAKCFVNSESFLSKMLHSPIMVSCFYYIFSIFTSISIAYSVLDYNWMMWGIVFCTIVVCAAVFGVFEEMLKSIIKEDYLMLMSREVSAFVGGSFLHWLELLCDLSWQHARLFETSFDRHY